MIIKDIQTYPVLSAERTRLSSPSQMVSPSRSVISSPKTLKWLWRKRSDLGPLDDRGLRTDYSNHSFGVAVDINAEANGLYDRCMEWGPECRLRLGGEWDPHNPLSVVEGNAPHRHMTDIGLLWGGALEGRQKDFMHFSLTGN